MDTSRVRAVDWVIAFLGLIVFVSLFLPWYESNSDSVTGWQSFAWIDKILLITALLALAQPIVGMFKPRPRTQKLTFALVIFAALSVICIVIRLFNFPEFDAVATPVQILGGAWLGLAASVATLLAGLKALGERRTSPARVAAQA